MRAVPCLLFLILAACSTTPGVAFVPAQPAAAASPCAVSLSAAQPLAVVGAPCAAAAAPAGQVSAQVVGVQATPAGQYVQVQYRVGAQEYARAAMQIPGNVVVCVGNFVRCLTDALLPVPQPTVSLVPAAAPAGACASGACAVPGR